MGRSRESTVLGPTLTQAACALERSSMIASFRRCKTGCVVRPFPIISEPKAPRNLPPSGVEAVALCYGVHDFLEDAVGTWFEFESDSTARNIRHAVLLNAPTLRSLPTRVERRNLQQAPAFAHAALENDTCQLVRYDATRRGST